MTLYFHWQLDVAAEPQRSERAAQPQLLPLVRDRRTRTQNRYDYYTQVSEAAAQTAFDGLFLPHRPASDESRIIAAVVARAAPRLVVIPEFPASVGSAVYAAKQAVTFQRSTHDRLGWAIAPSGDAQTRAAEGDFLPEEQLDDRLEEFLVVARGVHGERPFTFAGEHFEVQNGGFEAPLNRVPFPTVFLQGEREEDLSLSARHADVHLFAPAPVEALAARIELLDSLAKGADRTVAFGLVQPVLAREFAEDVARVAAQGVPEPGTLVGTYDEVAAQLADLARLGISHFILTAEPSLEEAYRLGQHLLPRVRALTDVARAAA